MQLADYLEKAKLKRPAFVAELAKHGVKVNPQTIKWWEEGERNPSTNKMAAIEKATNGKVTRYDLRPDVFGPAPRKRRAA